MLIVSTVLVLVVGVGHAQIVRQGEQTEFHSPMVLELAFPLAERSADLFVDKPRESVRETEWLTVTEPDLPPFSGPVNMTLSHPVGLG